MFSRRFPVLSCQFPVAKPKHVWHGWGAMVDNNGPGGEAGQSCQKSLPRDTPPLAQTSQFDLDVGNGERKARRNVQRWIVLDPKFSASFAARRLYPI